MTTTRKRVLTASCLVATLALGLTLTANAAAGTPTTRSAPGISGRVSCLSAKLCLLVGYNRKGVGDVIRVNNGVPGKVTVVKHSQAINLISCVPGSGCVTIGRTSNDVGTLVVPINKHGKVGKAKTVNTKPGVNITAISCIKAKRCGVAGSNTLPTPAAIETGMWNGKKFSLHKTHGIKGSSILDIAGISCFGANCTVVGYTVPNTIGLIFTTKHGKAGKVGRHKNDVFNGVACASKSLCYAVGTNNHGGLVLTLRHGKITNSVTVTPGLNWIACRGTSCTAVGEQTPQSGSTQGFDGSIVAVSKGKVKSSTRVTDAQGYSGVAVPRSGHYVAVGEGKAGLGTTAVTVN